MNEIDSRGNIEEKLYKIKCDGYILENIIDGKLELVQMIEDQGIKEENWEVYLGSFDCSLRLIDELVECISEVQNREAKGRDMDIDLSTIDCKFIERRFNEILKSVAEIHAITVNHILVFVSRDEDLFRLWDKVIVVEFSLKEQRKIIKNFAL